MTATDQPPYRVYTCEEGARRIGGIVKASTLYRLARERKVTHERNGRKVGYTDEQLAGVVEYLATRQATKPSAAPRQTSTRSAPAPEPARGNVAPLVSRPGSRYTTTV